MRAAACSSEEASKMFLVLPFVEAILGYDIKNPLEVTPEHPADFGDKFKNRVDYVIMKDAVPVTCIECKKVGGEIRDERGQLRGYFNSMKTVKLAILTDGLRYKFFADSEEPNMMDSDPYISFDLLDVAKNKIEKSTVSELSKLTKESFDPENIGSEAKKKAVFDGIIRTITDIYNAPNDDFVRLMLASVGLTHLRGKTLDQFRPIVGAAFKEFVDNQILTRLDISKKESPKKETNNSAEKPTHDEELDGLDGSREKRGKIVTTEIELEIYHYIKERLAYLFREEDSCSSINNIHYRDYVSKFVIFYERERLGRLVEVIERKEWRYSIYFPIQDQWVNTNKLEGMDDLLVASFRQRLREIQIETV